MIRRKRTSTLSDPPGDANTDNAQDVAAEGSVSAPSASAPKADTQPEAATPTQSVAPTAAHRRSRPLTVAAFATVMAVAVASGATAGYCKWQYNRAMATHAGRLQAVDAARETIVAMLSYTSDNVEPALKAARDRLADPLRQTYTKLIDDVVIPGARQQKITALAQVAAIATISATPDEVVVIAFVNQNMTVGSAAPTDSASTVQLTLDKVDGQWRASAFTPI